MSVADEIQDTVHGIARVLMAESEKPMVEVWEEALSLYRAQFNHEVLPDPVEDKPKDCARSRRPR